MATTANVITDLRRRLAEGEWPVDTPFPGTPELQRQYDAALHTIRKAQHTLRDEGWIRIQQGHPTMVIKLPPRNERTLDELWAEHEGALQTVLSTAQELRKRLAG
jgi:DNA-binding GntR family transcriptional regulator